MEKTVTLTEILELVTRLSLVDKVRLIERVAPQIEQELSIEQPKPRKSLRGLWRGVDISGEDIAEARRDMGRSFPREDI